MVFNDDDDDESLKMLNSSQSERDENRMNMDMARTHFHFSLLLLYFAFKIIDPISIQCFMGNFSPTYCFCFHFESSSHRLCIRCNTQYYYVFDYIFNSFYWYSSEEHCSIQIVTINDSILLQFFGRFFFNFTLITKELLLSFKMF